MNITILNGNPDMRNATFDEKMVQELAEPEKIPTLMRLIVQLVWKISGNGYWDDWLKENDAYEKSFARPYVE